MEFLNNLALGLSVAITPVNLAYGFVGVVLGTAVGVLPGLGPVATISLLVPITFALPAPAALIMLATAAIASLIGGTIGTSIIALMAPTLADVALDFGPADYFSLMLFGLLAAVVIAHGSVIKAIGMILLGILFGMVGTDVNTGMQRFTFGIPELSDGLNFAVVAMGLFGIGETVANLANKEAPPPLVKKLSGLMPNWADLKALIPPALRGTGLGSALGLLPGGGPVLASFSSYALEKKVSKQPGKFGHGAIEGVAAPEAANNAAAQTSFIPMLTLGLPSSAVMALMIGALTVQGITPGPQLMEQRPDLFWGLIVSMWIGNFMLVILNLPLVGMWVKLFEIPARFLYPGILMFCCVGVYSLNSSPLEVVIATLFGLFGFICNRLRCEPAPLLLGFVLGPMIEENLRRALLISHGDAGVFVERPISAAFLILSVLLLVSMLAPAIRKTREQAFKET